MGRNDHDTKHALERRKRDQELDYIFQIEWFVLQYGLLTSVSFSKHKLMWSLNNEF